MQGPPPVIDNEILLMTISMVKMYDMPIFAVDLIKESYHTTDPFEIAPLLEELFDIKLEIQEIIELVFMEEDKKLKPESYSCKMHEVFNEC